MISNQFSVHDCNGKCEIGLLTVGHDKTHLPECPVTEWRKRIQDNHFKDLKEFDREMSTRNHGA